MVFFYLGGKGMKFSNINRNEMIDSLKNKEFDVLVIGGGLLVQGLHWMLQLEV